MDSTTTIYPNIRYKNRASYLQHLNDQRLSTRRSSVPTPSSRLLWDQTNLGILCKGYGDNILIIVKGKFENILCDTVERELNYTKVMLKWDVKSTPVKPP